MHQIDDIRQLENGDTSDSCNLIDPVQALVEALRSEACTLSGGVRHFRTRVVLLLQSELRRDPKTKLSFSIVFPAYCHELFVIGYLSFVLKY
jgi:hypothetical protein